MGTRQYTLWKFDAYIDGKGEETQLEYKEPKDGRTEEERHEERDNMCKEMAERLSRLHPGVEIAVYASDYYSSPYTTVCWDFYRAKDGRATKDYVDHPMEFAAEVIKRARDGEDYCPAIAAEMILNGNTVNYFSMIEPADKEWLTELIEKRRLKHEMDWADDELPR